MCKILFVLALDVVLLNSLNTDRQEMKDNCIKNE